MAPVSVIASAERNQERDNCLTHAQSDAARKHEYNSEKTRKELSDLVRQRCGGKVPYSWQLDTAEALILGVDSIVIAGTGAGKTLPFIMPLFKDKKKSIIIISPLKALQRDQKQRFKEMKVSAIDVNSDTWSTKIREELKNHRYQAVLVGPEMCLQHEGFRDLLKSSDFTKDLVGVVIDEAHCISQWGGDFRPAYNKLSDLWTYVPLNVPILATSATLTPAAVQEIRQKLHISPCNSFFVNLGNDRPNITPSVIQMKNAQDYAVLLELVTKNVMIPEDLEKMIIFTNLIQKTLEIQRFLRKHLPMSCHPYIDIFHSLRSARSKKRSLQRFREGVVRVLVATEAAGMGADIPDIKLVIQFGVPSSLEVWTQCAGRAGRSPNLQARAILIAEQAMFQQQKRAKKKRKVDEENSSLSDSECTEDESAEPFEDPSSTWRKVVDPNLRGWIEIKTCRRDFADKYFDNPKERQRPLGDCCDRCVGGKVLGRAKKNDSRPQTPVNTQPISTHTTPTRSPDTNRKHPMTSGPRPAPEPLEFKIEEFDQLPFTQSKCSLGLATRRGELLKKARAALTRWRLDIKLTQYSPSPLTAECILPDTILTTLASNAQIKTLSDMSSALKKPWMLMDKHGDDVLKVLQDADHEFRQSTFEARRKQKEAAGSNVPTARPVKQAINEPLVGCSQFNINTQVFPATSVPAFVPSSAVTIPSMLLPSLYTTPPPSHSHTPQGRYYINYLTPPNSTGSAYTYAAPAGTPITQSQDYHCK